MTSRGIKRWWLALSLVVIAAVGACTEAVATPVPTADPDIIAGQPPVAPSPTVRLPSVTLALPTTPTPPLPPIATLEPTATPTSTPTPTPTITPEPTPVVTIGGVPFVVEVARTIAEQAAGLSDRDELREGTGMLFPQSRDRIPVFWMRRMRFPLDLLWIAADCTLAEVTPDVPPPGEETPTTNLPTYSPAAPVRYVLEINAGAAQADGLTPGDPVRFSGRELSDLSCSTL